MATFARVPAVPGPVREVFIGDKLFEMHGKIAATWHVAPDGTKEGYQYDGKAFSAPVATAVDPKAEIKQQIAAMEWEVTSRRLREAVLGVDDGWLKSQNDQIAALRAKL